MYQYQCLCLKHLFTTDMNRSYLAETRGETTYKDVGNVAIAGANIYHPWWLGSRIPSADGLSKITPVHVSR